MLVELRPWCAGGAKAMVCGWCAGAAQAQVQEDSGPQFSDWAQAQARLRLWHGQESVQIHVWLVPHMLALLSALIVGLYSRAGGGTRRHRTGGPLCA